MGFRINYLGAKCDPEELTRLLNLKISGTVREMPYDESWVAQIRESGWTVLWIEDDSFIRKNRNIISQISESHDLLACDVNETCMWSSAEYLRAGKTVWKVTHAGDGGDIFNLTESGGLPDGFEDLKIKHVANQKADEECDHIFEIPLDAASIFLRFRHDKDLEPEAVSEFHVLEPKPKRGFFSLFGISK